MHELNITHRQSHFTATDIESFHDSNIEAVGNRQTILRLALQSIPAGEPTDEAQSALDQQTKLLRQMQRDKARDVTAPLTDDLVTTLFMSKLPPDRLSVTLRTKSTTKMTHIRSRQSRTESPQCLPPKCTTRSYDNRQSNRHNSCMPLNKSITTTTIQPHQLHEPPTPPTIHQSNPNHGCQRQLSIARHTLCNRW